MNPSKTNYDTTTYYQNMPPYNMYQQGGMMPPMMNPNPYYYPYYQTPYSSNKHFKFHNKKLFMNIFNW